MAFRLSSKLSLLLKVPQAAAPWSSINVRGIAGSRGAGAADSRPDSANPNKEPLQASERPNPYGVPVGTPGTTEWDKPLAQDPLRDLDIKAMDAAKSAKETVKDFAKDPSVSKVADAAKSAAGSVKEAFQNATEPPKPGSPEDNYIREKQ